MGREVRDRQVKENHPLKGTRSRLGCVGCHRVGEVPGEAQEQKL